MEKYRICVYGDDVFGEPHVDQIEVEDCRDGTVIGNAQINSPRGKSILYIEGEQLEYNSYSEALFRALCRFSARIERLESERAEKVRASKEAFRALGGAILRGHGIAPPA